MEKLEWECEQRLNLSRLMAEVLYIYIQGIILDITEKILLS
jgi:hypothetical protein